MNSRARRLREEIAGGWILPEARERLWQESLQRMRLLCGKTVLRELRTAGLALRVAGDQIGVKARIKPEPELLDRVKAFKVYLLLALTHEAEQQAVKPQERKESA